MSSLLYCLLIVFIMILLNYNCSSTTTFESTTKQSLFRQAIAEFLEQENNLTKAQEQLKIDREKFENEKKQMQKSVENTDVIQLNVGGQIIMTTRDTLTRVPKSNLAIMFNGRWEHKLQNDKDGNIFFDFNPILFRHLLDQLQILDKNNPSIFHPPSTPAMINPFNKMLRKLDFYSSLLSETRVITLNVGGHIVTTQYKISTESSNSTISMVNSSFDTTKLDICNNVFVDHDPKPFRHLINQLREERLQNPFSIKVPSHVEKETFNRMLLNWNVNLPSCLPKIDVDARCIQNGTTIAGGKGQGNGLNQLSYPHGIYVTEDQTIYIADFFNHRVVKWKNNATSGQVVAGGNEQGNRTDHLHNPTDVIIDKESDYLIICDYGNRQVVRWPRQNGTSGKTIISDIDCHGLAMDNNGYLYIADSKKHEVRRFRMGEARGTVVAGGNGQGNRLDQLNSPYYIFVDQAHSVYVSDGKNHRVMKWMKDAKEGVVVAGGQSEGNGLTELSNPYGVIVDLFGSVYVADCYNYRVMRWSKGDTQGSIVVGGKGPGAQSNKLNIPVGLSFDQQGNLYVVDNNNYRVQKFNIDSSSSS